MLDLDVALITTYDHLELCFLSLRHIFPAPILPRHLFDVLMPRTILLSFCGYTYISFFIPLFDSDRFPAHQLFTPRRWYMRHAVTKYYTTYPVRCDGLLLGVLYSNFSQCVFCGKGIKNNQGRSSMILGSS